MSIVFDKVDHDEFDSGEKTGNGSSFVRHIDKNRRKRPKIGPRFANMRPPRTRGASAMPPARRSDSEYAECHVVCNVLSIVDVTDLTRYQILQEQHQLEDCSVSSHV